jgi:hypothetical protein
VKTATSSPVHVNIRTVKRCLLLVVLVALPSCTPAPPAYESRYVSPTTSAPPSGSLLTTTPPLPEATFADNFDRPDTKIGLGEGWDMRGPFQRTLPLPPATDGFIKGGRYTYVGASTVYAVRQFRGQVRSVGTVGRFRKTGDGAETAMSMAIVPNDNLVTDVIHFAAKRTGWVVQLRRANGVFRLIAEGEFSPTLNLDQDYKFELEATDNSLTVTVPGAHVTKTVSTTGLLGDRAFWEEYPASAHVGVVFDFDTVWAVEDGQPLFPVAG